MSGQWHDSGTCTNAAEYAVSDRCLTIGRFSLKSLNFKVWESLQSEIGVQKKVNNGGLCLFKPNSRKLSETHALPAWLEHPLGGHSLDVRFEYARDWSACENAGNTRRSGVSESECSGRSQSSSSPFLVQFWCWPERKITHSPIFRPGRRPLDNGPEQI